MSRSPRIHSTHFVRLFREKQTQTNNPNPNHIFTQFAWFVSLEHRVNRSTIIFLACEPTVASHSWGEARGCRRTQPSCFRQEI